ncbi:MAG: class I SAM-dependent methyltransferase [Desulfosarcinaceae bacterium]|nr:class I SAM-dependent methyltransferase [Desulfosarcinaceae bacterium]
MTARDPDNGASRLTEILNHGALNLALAIGYRAGIFDVMDSLAAPGDCHQLSLQSGVDARYLKEWLGIMVCGGIIDLHNDSDGVERYSLPKHYADHLCRRAGHNNLGVYMQEIPLLTNCSLEALLSVLASGDGISYDHYPSFQGFMTQLADAKHREVLVTRFLPFVEGGRIFTALKKGIRVCDLGCGTGLAVSLMAAAFPDSEFVGLDRDPDAVSAGRRSAAEEGLQNLEFGCIDVASAKCARAYRSSFDYITAFDAIHDQTRPLDALRNAVTMLQPAGAFSMIDIAASSFLAENRAHPMGPFLYTVSLMHCLPVGLEGGGAGLGMMWGRQKAAELLSTAGFTKVHVEEIPHDPFNLHYYCRL